MSYRIDFYKAYAKTVAVMPGPEPGIGTYRERERYYDLLTSVVTHTNETMDEIHDKLRAALPENPHIGHYYKALYNLVCPCKDCDCSRVCRQHCKGGAITAAHIAAFNKGIGPAFAAFITGENKTLAERLKEYKHEKRAAIEEIRRAERNRLERRRREYNRALNIERHRRNPRVEAFDTTTPTNAQEA